MNHIALEAALNKMYNGFEERGLKARIVSIRHLPELQAEVQSRYAQGQLAEEFYQERMDFYRFRPPDDFPSPRCLIVVAVPRPQTPVSFTHDGKSLTLILPPTYSGFSEVIHDIGDCLNSILRGIGYRAVKAVLPLKLLAVRSGLAEYGRNNIGYTPGMGSFFQLVGYYSDLPCLEDSWQEPRMMERCKNCRACQKACPTDAISPDRFLLHAERCLVFHNERPQVHPFPAWIDPAAHNCLMACMLCQRICPVDKPFMDWFKDSQDFSAKETALLLQGTPRHELPEKTAKKLEALGLIDDVDKFPRNLGVFFGINGETLRKQV